MPLVKIFVNDTGTVKELTGTELDAFLADQAIVQAEIEAEAKAVAEKAKAKAALLDKLGITADEAALLLG
jgi:DNA gyrase/topoisomerase IV subunit B